MTDRRKNMEKLPKNYIFDTDMDTDCDDAAALALLVKNMPADGKLLAVVTDVPSRNAPGACEAILRYNGAEAPVGTIYDDEFSEDRTDRYVKYRAHVRSLPDGLYYNRVLAGKLGKTDRDYRPSAEVYREALSKAADGSVTVIVVGFMTAIEQLWLTGPDVYSELDGYELFRKKVAAVVSMGNAEYPRGDDNIFNYQMDAIGAYEFFKRCPCPVYMSPDGWTVVTGMTFTDRLRSDDPVRISYEMYNGGEHKGRMSWDLITTLFAIGIRDDLFTVKTHGTARYDAETDEMYWEDGPREDFIVHAKISDTELTGILEDLVAGE